LLLGDPFIRTRFEKIERHAAAVEHLVVKGAEVKVLAECLPGAIAKFEKLKLTDLVA
jgi:hypothetical protein